MDKNQVMKYLVAILSTLVDCEESTLPIPKSSIYMALGCDINKYNDIENLMVGSDLVKVTSETISLTDKGRALGIKCNEAIKKT